MNRNTIYAFCRRSFINLQQWWVTILKTPKAADVIKWMRRGFVVAILSYMVFQFFKIGWGNLWESLPDKPLFYLLYLPLFFLLPISELFIYRIMWSVPWRRLFLALLVKKVYNNEILGYSGEVFLFWWGKKELGKGNTDIIRNIKDNNVISVIVSTLFTFIVLILFFETHPAVFEGWFQKIPNSQFYYAAAAIVIIAVLSIRFKKHIISLSLISSLEIFSLHFIRHILIVVIQIYQWHIILPDVSYHVWFTFVVAQIVLAMLPFVPNKDLLFISISMSMSTMLKAPLAAVTAILVVNSVFDRTLHLSIYSTYQFLVQKKQIFADLKSPAVDVITESGLSSDVETGY